MILFLAAALAGDEAGRWTFGDGKAMLAAAGAPDAHRLVWDGPATWTRAVTVAEAQQVQAWLPAGASGLGIAEDLTRGKLTLPVTFAVRVGPGVDLPGSSTGPADPMPARFSRASHYCSEVTRPLLGAESVHCAVFDCDLGIGPLREHVCLTTRGGVPETGTGEPDGLAVWMDSADEPLWILRGEPAARPLPRGVRPVWADLQLIVDPSSTASVLAWTGKAKLKVVAERPMEGLLLWAPWVPGGDTELTELTVVVDGVAADTAEVAGAALTFGREVPAGATVEFNVRWRAQAALEALDSTYLGVAPYLPATGGRRWPHRVVVDLPVATGLSAATSGTRGREELLGSVRRLVSATGPDIAELPVVRFGAWDSSPRALAPGVIARVRLGTQLDLPAMATVVAADLGHLYPLLGPPSCSELELVEQELLQTLHWSTLGCVVTIGRFRVPAGALQLLDDRYTATSEYVLAHELAHLWFPGTVDMRSPADGPIAEALAEYLACRVLELTRDPGACARRYVTAEKALYTDLHLFTAGAFDTYDQQSNGTAYDRWILAIRTLEARVGRPALDAALSDVTARFRDTGMRLEDLEATVDAHSEEDLTAFFRTWRAAAIPARRSAEGGVALAPGTTGHWELPFGDARSVRWVTVGEGLPPATGAYDPGHLLSWAHGGR